MMPNGAIPGRISPQPSFKSRTNLSSVNFVRTSRSRGRSMAKSMTHRSDFSLTTDDASFGHVELELGASNEDLNSLAYSVYSNSRAKLNQHPNNLPVAGGPINLPAKQKSKAKRPLKKKMSSNETSMETELF